MVVDFQKLTDELSETRQEMRTLRELITQFTQSPQPAEEPPLTVQQAADFLGLTTATITTWYTTVGFLTNALANGSTFYAVN